jgi:hypothetical protein
MDVSPLWNSVLLSASLSKFNFFINANNFLFTIGSCYEGFLTIFVFQQYYIKEVIYLWKTSSFQRENTGLQALIW